MMSRPSPPPCPPDRVTKDKQARSGSHTYTVDLGDTCSICTHIYTHSYTHIPCRRTRSHCLQDIKQPPSSSLPLVSSLSLFSFTFTITSHKITNRQQPCLCLCLYLYSFAPSLFHSNSQPSHPKPPNMSDPRRSMPLTFLSLGPVTSESFPKSQQPKQAGDAHKRRSSSLSSDGKGSAPGYRVLKVAPVHYGEHAGDHQDDWHNAAAVAE